MNTIHVAAQSPWLLHAAAALILFLHIAGGTVGMTAGAVALVAPKGRRVHAFAGNAFFVSMMVMALIGAFVAPFLVSRHGDPKLFDSIGGLFTCYLVATSWITVKRKAGTLGRAEVAAFGFACCLAGACALLGATAGSSPDGVFGGSGSSGFYALGSVIGLAAAWDAKVILHRGITGSNRIARHLWRMCLALLIAVGSFFLGQQRIMPETVQGSSWLFVPPLAVLTSMLFWLVKLRSAKLVNRLRAKLGFRRRQAAAVRPA